MRVHKCVRAQVVCVQALTRCRCAFWAGSRLCILKGIYPREPRHRKRVGHGNSAPKTYYWVKDIAFLAHEPLLQKFRDYKVFARKLRKALGKHQVSVARHLEANRPVYTLDHLIKERCVRCARTRTPSPSHRRAS